MKKLVSLFAGLLFCGLLAAQDFSNKGKEFWISYAGHIDGNLSAMGIYITSDVAATGTVTVGNQAVPYTVQANSVTRIFIGSSGNVNASNAAVYLGVQDQIVAGAAIHVTSDKPVAVYAHIIRSARSGATLVLPVNVWGKEYIVPSYRNMGASASYGEINIMAAEASTVVEITPTVATRGGRPAGVPFTITLNPGDVYQVQFALNEDISGTKVRSIASGTSGCKPIGVFSATTWSGFDCTNASGGDNLYQQLFPISAWGKNFLTAPFYSRNYDIVRVFVSDPSTIVTQNLAGVNTILTGLVNNSYYEYKTGAPSQITANKPVSVIQYITSQTCGRTPNPNADPEMVVLNPVEQTVNNITVFSAHQNYVPSGQSAVTACYLNIIIQTAAAASFKINNAPPTGTFTQIPNTNYSYLQENVTSITLSNPVQTLKADSAFSAIAYGFGNVESYGYNAGTNVKDLFQHIIIQNQYASVDYPTTCVATPFRFAITLPYLAQSLTWDFHGAFTNITNNAPVPDSSYVIDNRTVYVYRLPTTYTFNTIGTYPVTVTAINPTSDGCSGSNQIDYDVEVVGKPNASFYFTHSGCISDTAYFHDTTNAQGRPIIKWNWQFGDNTTAGGRDTVHLYQASGTFPVKLTVITDVGCLADTTISLAISPAPVAKFGASIPQCTGSPVIFTDSSTIAGGAIIKWYWDYGNGQHDTLTTNSPRSVTYNTPNTYIVKLVVEGAGGCKSIAFTRTVVVHAKPTVDFTLPTICLPAGSGQFTSTVNSTDNPQPSFAYNWDFGDNTTSNVANPTHQFTNAGPFNIKLFVTSSFGCKSDTITKALTSIYARPQALFTAPAEVCLGDTASFTDQSNAPNSIVRNWHWDFGDGVTDTVQNPKHLYTASATRTVKLYFTSAAGCNSDTVSNTIIINALPTVNFTIGNPNCVGQSILFSSTSIAGAGIVDSLRWNFGDNTLLDTNRNTVVHTYNTAASYTTSLRVKSSKGCLSPQVQQTINVHVLPVANFGLPQVCLNDPFAEFTDSSTISDGTSAALTYLWNFGDPTASPSNPNTSTVKNGRHRYTTSGTYPVTLTVSSGSGCSTFVTKQITINGGAPLAAFDVQNTGKVCQSDSVIIQNKSTVNFGSITRTEIIWDFASNPTVKEIDSTPALNKLYKHLYSNISAPLQQFVIQLNAYSGGVCVNSLQKTITLYPNPVAAIGLSTNQVCQNQSISFIDNSTNTGLNITNWNWQFGDASTGSTQSVAHTYRTANTFTVQLQNETADGCKSAIATRQVTINPLPTVNAGLDQVVLEGGQVQIKASVSGSSAYKYSWTPGTWLNDTTALQPISMPQADITYTITVTGAGNCTASDEVVVKLLKGLVIPNAFTPNGDGINDKWVIEYLESYPGSVVNIFDRYGKIVFTSKATGYISWDGTVSGKPLPIGTYYYIIDPKNGRKALTGSVTILR